jgi:hypothetical protein
VPLRDDRAIQHGGNPDYCDAAVLLLWFSDWYFQVCSPYPCVVIFSGGMPNCSFRTTHHPRAAVEQRKIVDVGADGIGVASIMKTSFVFFSMASAIAFAIVFSRCA